MESYNQALLSTGTKVINEILETRVAASLNGTKLDVINGKIHDIFEIHYIISNPSNNRNVVKIEFFSPMIDSLSKELKDRIHEHLRDVYGKHMISDNPVTLQYDFSSADPSLDIKNAQFLKKNSIFGLVNHYIEGAANSESRESLALSIGRKDKLYLIAKDKAFWAIFSIYSDDASYFLFLCQFSQEFRNLQKLNNMAPSVSYNEKDAPQELKSFNLKKNDKTLYISIMFTERYFSPRGRAIAADMLTILPMQIYYTVSNYNMLLMSRLRDMSTKFMKRINRCKYVEDKKVR